MSLDKCEIRSTMSLAFSLAKDPICFKAWHYWFDCSSSSISSCCSSESAAQPVQCLWTADIHILPCTASMCAGADWGGWCNLTGLDVLWRFGEAQVDTVSMDMLSHILMYVLGPSLVPQIKFENKIQIISFFYQLDTAPIWRHIVQAIECYVF